MKIEEREVETDNKINKNCRKLIEIEIKEVEGDIKFKKERLRLLKEINQLDLNLEKELLK